jgi:hypothetical protein
MGGLADNPIDLKIARALFKIGDPRVGEIEIFTGRLQTALFSDQFESLAEALDVSEAASPVIDAINGICFVHDSARSPLKCGAIHMISIIYWRYAHWSVLDQGLVGATTSRWHRGNLSGADARNE